MTSKVFWNKDSAYEFARKVRGFVEITTDDKLGKQFIVFFKKENDR